MWPTSDIDATKMENCIQYHFFKLIPLQLKKRRDVVQEACHDAWTRLVATPRDVATVERQMQGSARTSFCQVFCQNLHRALLAPPMSIIVSLGTRSRLCSGYQVRHFEVQCNCCQTPNYPPFGKPAMRTWNPTTG